MQDQVGHHPFRTRRDSRSGLRTSRQPPRSLESGDLTEEMLNIVHRDPFSHVAHSLRPRLTP